MASKQPQGNGSGKFDVHQQDMGGWVRVFASAKQKPPEDLPVFLSHSLTEWFRLRPNLHIRCIVPVCKDGDTVELHCWYDAHLFPPSSAAPQPAGQKQG